MSIANFAPQGLTKIHRLHTLRTTTITGYVKNVTKTSRICLNGLLKKKNKASIYRRECRTPSCHIYDSYFFIFSQYALILFTFHDIIFKISHLLAFDKKRATATNHPSKQNILSNYIPNRIFLQIYNIS